MGAMTPVQHGVEASTLPGATVFGTTPASTPETVSFILQERNEPQLESAVEHGVRQFDSVGQFASTYGRSPSNISQLERYLAGYGIKTFAYSDHVDVSASGTAGQFDSALAVQQFQYHVPSRGGHNGLRPVPAQNVHGPSRAVV
jgi:kumamolisin